jgi:parvulin-like peptidyl-prolyl isomerase
LTRRASPVAGRSLPWEGLDEERRNALLLYGLIAFVVVFAGILIGWGYYKDKIAPKHVTVLTVGTRKFDYKFLERRVVANFKLGEAQPSSTLQDVVVATLQQIEIEELTRQAAKDQSITVTNDDIDNEIRSRIGLPSGIDRNTFAALYRQEVIKSGLPVSEYREIVSAQLIQTQLQKKFEDAVPDELEQVDAQFIKTKDEAAIKKAKQDLDGGAKFNLTALAYSIDDSKQSGGEVGWIARAEMPPKAAEALFTLPLNQASDPIQERDGWYIVLAQGREVQPVTPEHKQVIGVKTFDSVIQETRVRITSTNRLTEDQILSIGAHLSKVLAK